MKHIVVLTGAGISAESGLPTFRGADGLWEDHRIDEVATPEAFERNPQLVQRFYNERRRALLSSNISPNAAHLALARLEHESGADFFLITQNIDDLHERAGSVNVLHMHGNLLEVRCSVTGEVYSWREDVRSDTRCACCNRTDTLRPNVVWFGEYPIGLDRIFPKLDACDLFMTIGTSGQIYPAAGFAEHVRMQGKARLVELNLEPSSVSHLFSEKIYGRASEVVPAYVDHLRSTD
jgi:NAD-dependent deacetylase